MKEIYCYSLAWTGIGFVSLLGGIGFDNSELLLTGVICLATGSILSHIKSES